MPTYFTSDATRAHVSSSQCGCPWDATEKEIGLGKGVATCISAMKHSTIANFIAEESCDTRWELHVTNLWINIKGKYTTVIGPTTVFPRNLTIITIRGQLYRFREQCLYLGPDQCLRPVHVQNTTEKYKHRLALLNTDRDSLLLAIAYLYFKFFCHPQLCSCGRARTYLHNKYFELD